MYALLVVRSDLASAGGQANACLLYCSSCAAVVRQFSYLAARAVTGRWLAELSNVGCF